MNHPELLLLPVLMLLDYYLTIWGSVISKTPYREHFKIETYELNPIWRTTVDQNRWFNGKHLVGVIAVTVCCILLPPLFVEWLPVYEAFFGGLVVFLGCVVGNHVANIFIFYYLRRNPTEISGEVRLSHAYNLRISGFRYFYVLVPLSIVAIFVRAPFVIGGVVGILVLMTKHFIWHWRYKAKLQRKSS